MKVPYGVTMASFSSGDLLPEQMGAREQGPSAGAVWCPMKKSEMAVMRCGEYQKQLGCGRADAGKGGLRFPWFDKNGVCPFRARPSEVEALKGELSALFSIEESKRPDLCSQCYGKKKTVKSKVCSRCAGFLTKRKRRIDIGTHRGPVNNTKMRRGEIG